ncbi:LCCL domain-containing protein [Ruegeria sp. HKCCSP335]|uniref:LCCL domain-containing protein n=1 Tax=Ruegeria sp. HKCCSP335 TaxID=2794833 RepID=UPI001AE63CD1|nr:LCCL domain-containing protein [Ruegeria sp. HKCCSP335]
MRSVLVAILIWSGLAAAAQVTKPSDFGDLPDCWPYSKPWRITICNCSGSYGPRLSGDGIYKQGSDPCKAAFYQGLLDAGGNGTIAVEPVAGLSTYPEGFRNGVRSSKASGGPGYVVRPIVSLADIFAEQARSANFSKGNSFLDEFVGVWSSGADLYYFDGQKLIALTDVRGVEREILRGPAPSPKRTYPAGTTVMHVSDRVSDGFIGHWLFENQIWGRVRAELIHVGYLYVRPQGEWGAHGGLGISLFFESNTRVESLSTIYPDAFQLYTPLSANDNSLAPDETTFPSSRTAELEAIAKYYADQAALSQAYVNTLDSVILGATVVHTGLGHIATATGAAFCGGAPVCGQLTGGVYSLSSALTFLLFGQEDEAANSAVGVITGLAGPVGDAVGLGLDFHSIGTAIQNVLDQD